MTIQVEITAQPAALGTPLLVAGFFEYEGAAEPPLTGGALALDQALAGHISVLRTSGEFPGTEGVTLLLTPAPGQVQARRLLLVGYGPRARFGLAQLTRAGEQSVEQARLLGAEALAFAPCVSDGGVTTLAVADIAGAISTGALQESLAAAGSLQTFALLTGAAHATEAWTGVREAQAATRASH